MASITTPVSLGGSNTPHSLTEEIDTLLEHYLQLLDQYTTLRSELTTIQSSIHQNIARANFTADRGIRYGADCYDSRMQAIRTCECSVTPSSKSAVFSISKAPTPLPDPKPETKESEATKDESGETEVKAEKEKTGESTVKPKDPIRMFGILVPRALRAAQEDAIKMVDDLVPKLVGLDAEMKEVEIEIRRKRKFRGKAEALQAAEEKGNGIDTGRGTRDGVVA